MIKLRHWALGLALAGVVGGCKSAEPAGQVIAIVDGTEVTLAELNEEARARGLAVARDPELRDALLKELVERKLLVKQARARRLDQTPQYLLATRRLTEIALAQILVADTAAAGRSIGADEVSRFIADNPQAFAQRATITIDQLVPGSALPAEVIAALKRARSVDEMQSLLARGGITSRRNKVAVDSATLSREVALPLLALRPGKPFVLGAPGSDLLGQVVSLLPQPVPAEQRPAAARDALGRRNGERALAALLTSVEPAARVQYQAGFAPGSAKPNGKTSAR